METTTTISADGTAAVRPSGDIDLATHADLEAAIAEAVALPGVGAVEVDLAKVDFLDSSGISALIRGRRMADAAGIRYRISRASGIVFQVLDLSGVWAYLAAEEWRGD